MKIAGIKISRWVKETAMFELIHKHYPDAIYQYRTKWLRQQSLDVYVPSLKTAFEYQGIQHFSPVDYFGGEQKFKEGDILKTIQIGDGEVVTIDRRFIVPEYLLNVRMGDTVKVVVERGGVATELVFEFNDLKYFNVL